MTLDWIDIVLLAVIVGGLSGAVVGLVSIAIAELRTRRAAVKEARAIGALVFEDHK